MRNISFYLFVGLLFSLNIQADESQPHGNEINGKKESPFEFLIRRQYTEIQPLESTMLHETFPAYRHLANNKSQNTYLGFNYHLPKKRSYIESSFYELTRANLGKSANYCDSRNGTCVTLVSDIGSYYRMETELNFIRNLFKDKISLGGGIRYIRSNLTNNFRYSYLIDFSSRSAGPQVSLRMKTGDFKGFFFSLRLDLFFLIGTIRNRGHFTTNNNPVGFIGFNSETNSTSRGSELEPALNYKISDSILVTLGFQSISTKIKPGTKDVISNDSRYDFDRNFRNRFDSNYTDNLYSSYLQISLRF